MAACDVLLFVEDPGAANFAQGLPEALSALGLRATLLAAGAALPYLSQQSVACEPVGIDAEAGALLSAYRPRVLAVGTSENPRSLGLALLDAAKARSIPTLGFVDGPANPAYRFRGEGEGPLVHAPDRILVPDADTASAFSALGYPATAIDICGHPQWDRMRRAAAALAPGEGYELRRRLFPDCDPGRPVVVFAAEISTGLDPAQYLRSPEYTLTGNPGSSGRTEIVLDEFLAASGRLPVKPYLVLRLHPKQGPGDLAAYRDAFDLVSSGGQPVELIRAADAIVGMSSMLLQEAAILGRPTLSILPRESEKAWLPGIAAGATPCATRSAEVDLLLRRILSERPAGIKRPTDGKGATGALEKAAGAIAVLAQRARPA